MVIIIIDDDDAHLHLLERLLKDDKSFVATGVGPRIIRKYTDPADAIAEFPSKGPVVTLCDFRLNGCDGLDWLPDLARFDLGPIIVLSSQGDEKVAARAFRAGASDYLSKTSVFTNPQLLLHAIRDGIRRHKLDQRNRQLARELKQSNLELQSKNQRLTELTDTAHRFVDNVAHEFRTPLTVIKEFASIIRDEIGGPVTQDQKGFLDYIDAATRDLSQMVDDFLDTSKLRANRLCVDRQVHTVQQLFEQIRQTIESRAQTKAIEIDVYIDEGLPQMYCDLEKAGRALINLVTNAVKFSPEGATVELKAELTHEDDIRVSVTDTGPGLSEEDIAVIGERFEQGRPTRHHKAGKGFGLGLHIAKDLAQLNLGQLDIDSTIGEGSTFSFTIPRWDPQHVVRRLIQTVSSPGEHESVRLTVFEISCDDPGIDIRQMSHFVATAGHSMDLTLPVAATGQILMMGVCDEPIQWKKNLLSAWANVGSDELGAQTALSCHLVNTFSLPQEEEAVLSLTSGKLQGVRNCA